MEISANPLLEGADVAVDRTVVVLSENNRNAWCSVAPPVPQTRIYDPYLTFEFNATYLIEMVTMSGDPDRIDRYVRALTIQNDTGQGFTFIHDNSGTPKVAAKYNILTYNYSQFYTYF